MSKKGNALLRNFCRGVAGVLASVVGRHSRMNGSQSQRERDMKVSVHLQSSHLGGGFQAELYELKSSLQLVYTVRRRNEWTK